MSPNSGFSLSGQPPVSADSPSPYPASIRLLCILMFSSCPCWRPTSRNFHHKAEKLEAAPAGIHPEDLNLSPVGLVLSPQPLCGLCAVTCFGALKWWLAPTLLALASRWGPPDLCLPHGPSAIPGLSVLSGL